MIGSLPLPPARFCQNQPLAPFTTFKIGGRAKYLVSVFDVDGLRRALQLSENRLIIGRGSKLLIGDGGFDGAAILMRINTLKFFENRVYAGAGVFLPALSAEFARRGLAGLEWACGIPGSVGGAAVMNAGAYGFEMKDVIEYVDVLRDDRVVRMENSDCCFSYRKSGLNGDIVLGSMLKATQGDKEIIKQKRADYSAKRALAQPAGFNCGSIFKGAEQPAWKYIDACGLKGAAAGGAQISAKHANFIINNDSASAKDVMTLINAAKAEAYLRFGVRLREEVVYAGY